MDWCIHCLSIFCIFKYFDFVHITLFICFVILDVEDLKSSFIRHILLSDSFWLPHPLCIELGGCAGTSRSELLLYMMFFFFFFVINFHCILNSLFFFYILWLLVFRSLPLDGLLTKQQWQEKFEEVVFYRQEGWLKRITRE